MKKIINNKLIQKKWKRWVLLELQLSSDKLVLPLPLDLPVRYLVKHTCRPWGCLWNSKGRNWNSIYGCFEARTDLEIDCTNCHGWYFGYLWPYHSSYSFAKEYPLIRLTPIIVEVNDAYHTASGYQHFASGLCCGFSALVCTIVNY